MDPTTKPTLSQIENETEILVRTYEKWDTYSQYAGSTCLTSSNLCGRKFTALRDGDMNDIFAKLNARQLTYVRYIFKDHGFSFIHSEFTMTNCGIDEYSTFVQTLKDYGIYSKVGVVGYNIKSDYDESGPRRWVACSEQVIKNWREEGKDPVDVKIQIGDKLVGYIPKLKIEMYADEPEYEVASIWDLKNEKTKDFERKDYNLNDEFPLCNPDFAKEIKEQQENGKLPASSSATGSSIHPDGGGKFYNS